MVIVAILGVMTGYVTYELIYYLNPLEPRSSSSWFMSYAVGIARQHALHRWLTFAHKTPYWRSLFKAYIMYSGSLILSSGLNWFLVESLDIHHRLAWLCCGLITGLVSYFFLKKFVFKVKVDQIKK